MIQRCGLPKSIGLEMIQMTKLCSEVLDHCRFDAFERVIANGNYGHDIKQR